MSNSKQSDSSDLDGSGEDFDSKDSEDIETKEEFYDEYEDILPNVSRRNFMRGTAGTAAVATVGSAPKSVSPVQEADAQSDVLKGIADYAGSKFMTQALGFMSLTPASVFVGTSEGHNLNIKPGVSSTIDTVFDYMGDDDTRVLDEEDTLKTSDITISAVWNNTTIYFDSLTNVRNQLQLTRDNATSEGLVGGLEHLDETDNLTESQAEAQKKTLTYYADLQKMLTEDWNSLFYRSGGIIDAIEINDAYKKSKLSKNTDYKSLYVKYDNLKSADWSNTQYSDFDDFKTENTIYKEKEGVIHVEVEYLDDTSVKVPALVNLQKGTSTDQTVVIPFGQSVVDVKSGNVVSGTISYESEDNNTYSFDISRFEDLNADVISEYDSVIDLIRNAVSDAQSANFNTKDLLTVLKSSQLEGDAKKSNIASLQTAYASQYGETQTDPQDTNLVLTDANATDDKITVKTSDGTKRIDLSKEGVNLVTTQDSDIPKKSDGSRGVEKGGTFTAGDGTYVVDESTGEMYKVPDGQSLKAQDITKTTTDSDGNETTTSQSDVGYTNTDITTDQIDEVKNRLDVIEKQIQAVKDIKKQLKEDSGGGGLFGDSGSGILGFGLIGVVVAYIYGTQNSDGRSNRR